MSLQSWYHLAPRNISKSERGLSGALPVKVFCCEGIKRSTCSWDTGSEADGHEGAVDGLSEILVREVIIVLEAFGAEWAVRARPRVDDAPGATLRAVEVG